MSTRAPAVLAALWLASCTVGPDFVRPKADTPAQWSATALKPGSPQPASLANTSAIGDPAWWAQFGDAELDSLIARATAANLDLRQAALRIAEARAARAAAEADRWPALGANAGYSRNRFSEKTAQGALFSSLGSRPGSGPSFPNPYDQFQFGFDASWEPDLFGRVRRSVEAAEADATSAVEERRDLLVSLQGEVAHAYLDLCGAQLKRVIAQDNLRTQREVLTLARQARRAGLASELDVTAAAAQVAASESQLPLLTREAAVDINRLSALLAREPDALRTELETVHPLPPIPPAVPVGLPAELARRRPDIRAAEARLHAATARVGVAVASLYPRVMLSASFGTQAQHFPDLTDWAARFFTLGPSIELPIFQGGRLRATVRLEDVRAKEAAVAYAQTVLGALHEVENALVAYNSEQNRRAALESAAAQNRRALDLARQRYAAGVTSFLNVLDAERTLQQTELTLADSTIAVATDLVALYKALGGGWQVETDQAPSDRNRVR